MALSLPSSDSGSRGRALLGAALLAGGLFAGTVAPRHADAQLSVGADPLVTLSNGVVFDLSTTLLDDAGLADVQHVSYTLHLPQGVSVVSVSYPDGTGAISTFTSDNTQTFGKYTADTVATTQTAGVAVSASFTVVTLPTGKVLQSQTGAQGYTGDDLSTSIHLNV